MDLYAENILDHYRHPRGKQSIAKPSIAHREENLSCGDELSVELVIENNTVKEVGWQGTGCAVSQAAMSMLAEELAGNSLQAIESMEPRQIYELLGVPIGPRRMKCALLCLHTLKNAVLVYHKQPAQSWVKTVAVEDED